MGTAFARIQDSDTNVEARRGFKRYGPGNRQRIGKAIVRENPKLKELFQIWEEYKKIVKKHDIKWRPPGSYYLAARLLREEEYSHTDVGEFCLNLTERDLSELGIFFDRSWLGCFITALIDQGPEEDFLIPLPHGLNPDILCWKNNRNVTIIGDVKTSFCFQMSEGLVTLKGDVLYDVGAGMTGGKIIVNGNVGMVGSVHGHENGWFYIKGGEIHINGDIGKMGNIDHARVFHKGKIILDK